MADIWGEIRPEGSLLTDPKVNKERKLRSRMKKKQKKDQEVAMKLATGQYIPKEEDVKKNENIYKTPKSVVNRVTEYGALFNRLNQERLDKGLPPLKTAMEVLIDAMQSDQIDIKDKAKIADKLAPFESSRAPIISIEHVQNMVKEEEVGAEEALDDFLQALRKV